MKAGYLLATGIAISLLTPTITHAEIHEVRVTTMGYL